MVRYADRAFEKSVQRTADQLHALLWKQAEAKKHVEVCAHTRLVNTSASVRQVRRPTFTTAWRPGAGTMARQPVLP